MYVGSMCAIRQEYCVMGRRARLVTNYHSIMQSLQSPWRTDLGDGSRATLTSVHKSAFYSIKIVCA